MGCGVLGPNSSLPVCVGSAGLGMQEGSMGQQHWATSENPQNSPGWMSTSKALSKPSPLITSLSHPQLGEVGSGKKQWETRFSHSHPPSCFAATLLCVVEGWGGYSAPLQDVCWSRSFPARRAQVGRKNWGEVGGGGESVVASWLGSVGPRGSWGSGLACPASIAAASGLKPPCL